MTVSGRAAPDPPRATGETRTGTDPAGPYQRAWRFTAPALDASVPRLRHAVRDLITRPDVAVARPVSDELLLILSELVTNAVRHAAVLSPRITVEIALNPGWVKVAVGDDHPYRPRALRTDHARTGGRGLLLVDALTGEAGGRYDVEPTPAGGKIVWAALPLTS